MALTFLGLVRTQPASEFGVKLIGTYFTSYSIHTQVLDVMVKWSRSTSYSMTAVIYLYLLPRLISSMKCDSILKAPRGSGVGF